MTSVSGTDAGLCVVTGAFGYSGRYIATRLLAGGRRVRTLKGAPTGRPQRRRILRGHTARPTTTVCGAIGIGCAVTSPKPASRYIVRSSENV